MSLRWMNLEPVTEEIEVDSEEKQEMPCINTYIIWNLEMHLIDILLGRNECKCVENTT